MARLLGWTYAAIVVVAFGVSCGARAKQLPEICSSEAFVRESALCMYAIRSCAPCDGDVCPPCPAEDQCNAWAAERTRICTEDQ